MRILHIRLKNLNSLTGEWTVDLTHPAYVSDGIFAITGPTGAGKTTLLDAVCLALYGRTPRLNKVTKSANEIMSRRTSECFAELTFETAKGRFRCHWSQHRARGKTDGDLQPPKHEISDAATGQILESRLRDVSGYIEQVTGMDFDRFTRSMLLAQGGFAAFLQAPPDERAPILEQITGTEIYSHISMKVHERRAGERKKLDELQAQLDGMQLLSREDEAGLCTRLTERQDREKVLKNQHESFRQVLAWIDTMVSLEKEIATVEALRRGFETRRQAFEPASKRLDRALKALNLGGDYAHLVSLRQQQDLETSELEQSRKQIPVLQADEGTALKAQQGASAHLEQTRAVFRQESDVIRRVRELDLQIVDKRKQVDESAISLRQTRQQRDICCSGIETAQTSLKASQEVLDVTDRYLQEHAADEKLVEELTAIARMCEGLRETERQHADAQQALSAAQAEKGAAVEACGSCESACNQVRDELERAEKAYGQFVKEMDQMLGGREPADWRDELDLAKDRKRLLEQTEELLLCMDATRRELDTLTVRQEMLGREQMQLDGDIVAGTLEKTQCERDVGHLEKQAALQSRIQDLESQRALLEDGKPCPLCGSLEHPFAEGNVPAMDETRSELECAREKLGKVSKRLTDLNIRKVRTETDMEQIRRDLEHKRGTLGVDGARCAEILNVLKIEAAPEDRPVRAREELAATGNRMDQLSKIISDIDQKSRQEKAARTVLETTRAVVAESEKALQTAGHKRETAERELLRWTRESESLARRVKRLATEVLASLRPYGIESMSVPEIDGILKQLTARRDRWKTGQKDKLRHEDRIRTILSDLEKQRALLDKSDSEVLEKRRTCERLKQELDALAAERHRLYGARLPDEEEKRLADAVDRAEKSLEQARKDHGQAEQALTRSTDRIALLAASTAQRFRELTRLQQQLKDRWQQAGFADEAEFRAACLAEDERLLLEKQAKDLFQEQTELDTRQRDKTEALRIEREKNMTAEPRESVQQQSAACEADLNQTRKDIAAIEHRLAENNTLRTKQKERVHAIEAQKTECARWDLLHELIGSADGKKFRNFAQGLTFEVMVAHANEQLQKMNDRYLLLRDDTQPLELNVIDNYQAGEIRSTKNLSGGESFIVSLALSLGLSRMAGRNVRVDSLFLDEGFGTLDDDALETALETLAELRQDSKLIGVISHVPALRERIGTQIRVIPETGGRSRISGPGCRYIGG